MVRQRDLLACDDEKISITDYWIELSFGTCGVLGVLLYLWAAGVRW